jgi:nitrogen fixation protein NifU and related proteins
MDLYAENILDHYHNPHHKGHLKRLTNFAEDVNPLCGDKIRIELYIDKEGIVRDAAFSGEGCAISQAGVSLLMDKISGNTLSKIKKVSKEDIYKLLGVPLSAARVKCALLGLTVLQKAIKKPNDKYSGI